MPTTVSGFLKLTSTSADSSNVKLRFTLKGFTGQGPSGQQPQVPGIGLLGPTDNNGNYYVEFTPDGTGAVSGTIYSTRDATGLLAGDITIAGSGTAVWYDMQVITSGQFGPALSVHAKQGATLDPSNISAITTPVVVAAPTGDVTYSRLDGSNQPFTASIQIPSTGVYKLSTDTGLSRGAAATLYAGNGSAGDRSATVQAQEFIATDGATHDTAALSNSFRVSNSGVYGFTNGGTGSSNTVVSGISQVSAGLLAFGNGTNGDVSGSLQATSYRTATANPAASGTVRLAAADTIAFRNAGNSADIALSKNGYDQITATGLSNRILQNFTSTALTGAGGLSFQAAASKTIKANTLGAHGALLIRLAGSGTTASGGLANITVQFGGTNKTVLSIPGSTTFTFRLEATLANHNATGTQLITWTSQYNSTLSTQSNNTYSIDTTADQTLALGVVFNNASDNCTFQNMLVEIMPASAAI